MIIQENLSELIEQNIKESSNISRNLDKNDLTLKAFSQMEKIMNDIKNLFVPNKQPPLVQEEQKQDINELSQQSLQEALTLYQEIDDAEDKLINGFEKMKNLNKDLKSLIVQDTKVRKTRLEEEKQKQQDTQIQGKTKIIPMAKVKQSRFKDHLFIQQTFKKTTNEPEKVNDSLLSKQQFDKINLSEIAWNDQSDQTFEIQEKPQDQEKFVYVTNSRYASKYHKTGCKWLQKSKVEQIPLLRAGLQGYQACKTCHSQREFKELQEIIEQYLENLKKQQK